MAEELESGLDKILEKREGKPWTPLLPDEVSCLITSFLPSQPTSLRPKAYITLSTICTTLRKSFKARDGKEEGDLGAEAIKRIFGPSVVSRISDTIEKEVSAGMSFLAALFEVDWQSASAIFQEEGVLESLTDVPDLFPTSSEVSRCIATLLANASGHKACRNLISPQLMEWLAATSRQTHDSSVKATASVALVKLSRGAGLGTAEIDGGQRAVSTPDEEELARSMKSLVIDGNAPSLVDAVEGLVYMSTDPKVKEMLVDDPSFLTRLFSIIPRRKGSNMISQSPEDVSRSPLYGVVVIILHLCSYTPRLTDEQAQIAKLRRMASTASNTAGAQQEENDGLDDDEYVKRRGRKLVEHGALGALTAAARATDSPAVRLAAGRALLQLVEDKENRGQVLQAGGAKALLLIIQTVVPAQKSSSRVSNAPHLEPEDFQPIQALAKLAITSSPVQVFGPNPGAVLDAIRPFTLMLAHPTSSLLQRFEALMALTNLASQGGDVADRVAHAEGLLNKVELLMLEDHALVRRAATELICNLVGGCEEVYNKFGGQRSAASKSKLQVIVALCDVDDLPTRLAASGAVATLTTSPDACQSLLELQRERKRILPVLGNLIDPAIQTIDEEQEGDSEQPSVKSDPGLIHRGLVCMRNLLLSVRDPGARAQLAKEAECVGITRALVNVVQESSAAVPGPGLRPAVEALKWLLESGVQITV